MGHPSIGITLDSAMQCLVAGPNCSDGHEVVKQMVGPYARLVIILTILRGIVAFGQGQPRGGYVTSRWVVQVTNGEEDDDPIVFHNQVIAKYSHMLDKVCRTGYGSII